MTFGHRTTDDPLDVIANLQLALESRDVIGQAKGILMERHGISADDAFARLVAMSQHSNVKVREVAEHVVDLHRPVAVTAEPL